MRWTSGPSVRLLLYGLQSAINLGMIMRTAETYKVDVHAFDPHGIFANLERLETISDFACGALQRVPPHIFTDQVEVNAIRGHSRLIATTIEPDAIPLPEFIWQSGDLVAVGNEYNGLPEDILTRASVQLHIPMPEGHTPRLPPTASARTDLVARDGWPNLNVSISVGILLYSACLAAAKTGARLPAD